MPDPSDQGQRQKWLLRYQSVATCYSVELPAVVLDCPDEG